MKYAIAFFLSPDYTYILNDQEIQQTEQCWIGNSLSKSNLMNSINEYIST